MISWGAIPAGTVIPFLFDTFAGATGASATITGLAVTDIEVYKGVSMTQRTSDNGYALLDTDGIDIDGTTGIQGFSIDTGDNSDAGFFAAGSLYTVVVSAITIDSQTVNFVAGTFRLIVAENTAGTPVVDVGRISNDATAADNAESFFDGTGYAGTNNVIPLVTVTTTATNLTNSPSNGDLTATMKTSVTTAATAATPTAAAVTGNVGGNVTGSVGSVATGGIAAGSFAAGAIDAAAIAANAIGASEIANDAITAAKIATGAIDADALAADAVDEIWDEAIGDGSITARQAMRVLVAALAGKLGGAATTTVTIRNAADNQDVIVATVDASGNRTAITLTP